MAFMELLATRGGVRKASRRDYGVPTRARSRLSWKFWRHAAASGKRPSTTMACLARARSGLLWSAKLTDPSDQKLVERVKRGDKRAFDMLVLKYQHKIVGLVSRYLRDQDEVADVTQEAFIKAYRALPRFRGDSAFYTWLYRIAINTAKNHLVSKSRRPPDTDIDIDDGEFHDNSAVLRDNGSPEDVMATQQLEQVVYDAIDQLPEELKVAVTLREFEGLSYEEIAEVMECPVGTVRSRIFRAREAIEKKIAEIG
jgi:RNA polymerase sigma-70 factor, ECF subfamily